MRRRVLAILAIACSLATGLVVSPVQSLPAANAADSTVVVYRFWSPTYQGHFYTASVTERDSIIRGYDTNVWTYEGAAYSAYPKGTPGTVPLYRFWSATYNGHFYTASEAEKNLVIATYPASVWAYEGVAYNVKPKSASEPGTSLVHRFWGPTYSHHFYTASASEAAQVTVNYPRHIWTPEGTAFRVSSTKPIAAPMVNDMDCGDFSSWAQAQRWFDAYYPRYGDILRLDGDKDGVACESLRW